MAALYKQVGVKSQEDCDKIFTSLVVDKQFPDAKCKKHRFRLKQNNSTSTKTSSSQARAQQRHATQDAIKYLDETYTKYLVVVEGVSTETYDQTDHEYISKIVKHILTALDEVSKDPKWISKGIIYHHDLTLIAMCHCFFGHAAFIKQYCLEDSRLLKAIANISAARAKPKVLQQMFRDDKAKDDVADLFMNTVNNAINGCSTFYGFDHKELFILLISTNLVGELIKWFTYECNGKYSWILDFLMDVPKLIQKHFAKDTKEGELLQSILDGKKVDTNKIHPNVLDKFRSIRTIAQNQYLREKLKGGNSDGGDNVCGNCGKAESLSTKHLICSGCKSEWYCNAKCQKAHWSEHKSLCKISNEFAVNQSSRNHDNYDNLLMNTLAGNMFYILLAYARGMRDLHLSKSKLMLFVDFYGMAPALQSPPQFRVVPIEDCFLRGKKENRTNNQVDDKHHGEKFDWYGCSKTQARANMKMLKELSKKYQRMASSTMLICIRYPNARVDLAIQNLENVHTKNFASSDDIIQAFSQAYFDLDFDKLYEVVDNKTADGYRKNITSIAFQNLTLAEEIAIKKYHLCSVGDERTERLYRAAIEADLLNWVPTFHNIGLDTMCEESMAGGQLF